MPDGIRTYRMTQSQLRSIEDEKLKRDIDYKKAETEQKIKEIEAEGTARENVERQRTVAPIQELYWIGKQLGDEGMFLRTNPKGKKPNYLQSRYGQQQPTRRKTIIDGGFSDLVQQYGDPNLPFDPTDPGQYQKHVPAVVNNLKAEFLKIKGKDGNPVYTPEQAEGAAIQAATQARAKEQNMLAAEQVQGDIPQDGQDGQLIDYSTFIKTAPDSGDLPEQIMEQTAQNPEAEKVTRLMGGMVSGNTPSYEQLAQSVYGNPVLPLANGGELGIQPSKATTPAQLTEQLAADILQSTMTTKGIPAVTPAQAMQTATDLVQKALKRSLEIELGGKELTPAQQKELDKINSQVEQIRNLPDWTPREKEVAIGKIEAKRAGIIGNAPVRGAKKPTMLEAEMTERFKRLPDGGTVMMQPDGKIEYRPAEKKEDTEEKRQKYELDRQDKISRYIVDRTKATDAEGAPAVTWEQAKKEAEMLFSDGNTPQVLQAPQQAQGGIMSQLAGAFMGRGASPQQQAAQTSANEIDGNVEAILANMQAAKDTGDRRSFMQLKKELMAIRGQIAGVR